MMFGSRHLAATSALVVLCVGCSPPQSAPRPVAPAATAEPMRATTAEPAPPPAEPEHVEEPPVAARLREVVSRTLPYAQVSVLAIDDDGTGWASIAWQSIRIRVEYREHARGVSLPEHQVLAAAAFLHELDDAGVALSRTGRWLATESGSALECVDDPEADSPSFRCNTVSSAEAPPPSAPVALDPPDWMLPPSQCARARGGRASTRRDRPSSTTPPPEAARIAEVFARHQALNVSGAPLDETSRMLLVTSDEFGEGPTGVLLCVANRSGAESSLDCASTNIEAVEGVVASSPDRWLVLAESAYGNPRDNNRLLVSVQREEQGLIVDTLDLGGVAGEGHACEDRPGYCVDMEGVAHAAQTVAPDCVELRPGPRWHATHVRVGDRWIEETIEPAPNCAERYTIQEGLFVRADCGPTSSLPACPYSSAEEP